jgi:hypothetical protein
MNTIHSFSTSAAKAIKRATPVRLGWAGATAALALLALAGAAPVTQAQSQDALAIMNRSHAAYYYAAEGGHAKVAMVLTDKKGRAREREFWMVRRDVEEMGDQRYFTYFLRPADVQRTGFLVHKNAAGNDDRWLYVPALDLVKRIAADDRGSSFVGSDFTYEDVSGRLPILDDHQILGEERLAERVVYKIKNRPKEAGTAAYAYRISYIDKEHHLPLKEEYFDGKDRLQRVFEILEVQDVEGIPTAVTRRMTDAKKGSFTELSFSELSYETTLAAEDFSERMLRNPPRDYTR